MKSILFKLLMYLFKLLRLILLPVILLLVIAFFSQFIDNISQYPTLMKLNTLTQQYSQPVVDQIKMATPYKYHNVDFSLAIVTVMLLIVAHICSLLAEKCRALSRRIQDRKSYYDWRKQATKVLSKEKLSEMDSKFEALNASSTKVSDRKRILKEFATLKSQLDSMGQQLAFLAIDVVDSTGMKRDEDKYLAAYDFDRYNQLVNDSLQENGVVKYAMTPDGIMSCFRTVDDAVNTAKTLLIKLKNFNEHEKKMKTDFRIRCGINAGFVYMDDETPLEQVSDRAIDIAGHMQKYAKPNCINIAASAIEPLKTRAGFDETQDVIDEQKVFQWQQTH